MKTIDIIPLNEVQQFLALGKDQRNGCGMPQMGFTREQLIRRRHEQMLATYYYKIGIRDISVTVYHRGIKTFKVLRWQLLPIAEVFQLLDDMIAADVPQMVDALGADLSEILAFDFYLDADHFRATPLSATPRKSYVSPALSLISMQLEGMVACGASAPQMDRKRYVAPELRVVPFFAYAPVADMVDADFVISDSTMEGERNHAPRKCYVAPVVQVTERKRRYVAPEMEVTVRRKRYRAPFMLVSRRHRKYYSTPTSVRKAKPEKKVCWLFRLSNFSSAFYELKAWNIDGIVGLIALLCVVIPMFQTLGPGELEHGWTFFKIFCASFLWLCVSLGLKNPDGKDNYKWWQVEKKDRKESERKFAEDLRRQREHEMNL